jgi:hypothetical protein
MTPLSTAEVISSGMNYENNHGEVAGGEGMISLRLQERNGK